MRGSDILRIKRWLFFCRFIIISGSFVCSNTLCELFSLLLSFRRVYWVLLCFLGSFCPTKQEFYCVFTWWLFFFCSNEPIGPLNCGFTRFYRVLSAFGLVLPGFTWFFIVFFLVKKILSVSWSCFGVFDLVPLVWRSAAREEVDPSKQ